MAVYYWINQGRLGNILFQYATILQSISKDDCVLSFHNEAFDLLEIDGRFKRVFGNGRRARQLSYLVNSFADWSIKHNLVTSLLAGECVLLNVFRVESEKVMRRNGALKRLLVVKGFFQNAHLRETPLKIKPAIVAAAEKRLNFFTDAATTVGIHVRLTDYGTWNVLGAVGTTLSPDWYLERIAAFRKRLCAPKFVIFSDDILAAKRLGFGDDVVYFQGQSIFEDFTAMALCSHTVISPSSFAWWSAFAIWREDKVIMAPEYWAGFKSKLWYPVAIKTSGIEYYEVT